MRIAPVECRDLARALDYEWLETNGRGGFASGTVAGANTRRYHALLLVARRPPVDRVVLVNQVEDWVTVGDTRVSLATNLYPGAVYPEGYRACDGFLLDPWPTWSFEVCGVRLLREILCVRGRDLVIVRWRRVDTSSVPVSLSVRPKLSGRDYHGLHRENRTLRPDAETSPGRVTWHPYSDLPPVRAHHNGCYRHQDDWFRSIQLPVEQARGLDCEEDWWSPGEFTWALSSGNPAILAFSTEHGPIDAIRCIDEERTRRNRLESSAPGTDRLTRRLWTAAEAYISERGVQQTVIAGYPWFTDWGRDTFISLPGVCLVTGRHEVAREIIGAFASHVSEGMIPNRFPDSGEVPEYNTIDGSLWFVHTVGRYVDFNGHDEFVGDVAWPAVRQIVAGYRRGTRYGIRLDQDGLITGGEPGVQLTWMDAKVGEWVITPRHGKPVEIQTLWIRALEVAEELARRVGDPAEAERCRIDRDRARGAFQAKFWYHEGGYLYDVVDGPQGNDPTLRPNQLYALSLVEELLTFDQSRQILDVVRAKLLTPVGVRTLSPDDPNYRGAYHGGAGERDSAYHQGTVWPFLLGAFVTAWIKTYGASREVKLEARQFLEGLDAHLQQAGLGQVSEIFDAEPPHAAKGCFAQAWSVAEPLRVLLEDLMDVPGLVSFPDARGTRSIIQPFGPSVS